MTWFINRFIYCLKAVTNHHTKDAKQLHTAINQEQLDHRVMISDILHTLQLYFSEHSPLQSPELWLTSWQPHPHHCHHRASGQGSPPGKKERERGRQTKVSFNFTDTIKRTGIIWLDSDMILWKTILKFKFKLLNHLSLCLNSLQSKFKINHHIHKILTQTDQICTLFQKLTAQTFTAEEPNVKIMPLSPLCAQLYFQGAEIIIQMYILKIFNTLIWYVEKSKNNDSLNWLTTSKH